MKPQQAIDQGEWERLAQGIDSIEPVRASSIIIDCATPAAKLPYIDEVERRGWEQLKRRVEGSFAWDPSRLQLYRTPGQARGRMVKWRTLRTGVVQTGLPVYGISALQQIAKHGFIRAGGQNSVPAAEESQIFRCDHPDVSIIAFGDIYWCEEEETQVMYSLSRRQNGRWIVEHNVFTEDTTVSSNEYVALCPIL